MKIAGKSRYIIDASSEQFIGWLKHYTQATCGGTIDAKGECHWVLEPAAEVESGATSTRLAMKANLMCPSGDEKEYVASRTVDQAIWFVVRRLRDDRVVVVTHMHDVELWEYHRQLIAEMGRCWPEAEEEGAAPERRTTVSHTSSRPNWFPKTTKTLKRWKEAWGHLLQQRREYEEQFWQDDREDVRPSSYDRRTYLGDKMAWTPSDKTIRRILGAGDEGWLE